MSEATLTTITSTFEGVTLSVAVDADHTIVSGQFSGTQSAYQAALLTAFVDEITGKPIQEASDHGVIRLESGLRVGPRPVPGITLPENAGESFIVPLELIRRAFKEYRTVTRARFRDNTFFAPPSQQWLALSDLERLQTINTEMGSLLRAWGSDPDALRALSVDDATRITVMFRQGFPVAEKPALLMRLERELRARTDRAIELFVAEVKDENALRRL